MTACEDGDVVETGRFTGATVGSGWWLDTDYVVVRGASGYILYGELTPIVVCGTSVKKGELIGHIRKVLPNGRVENVPGHSDSMLHIELYRERPLEPVIWTDERPFGLLDPTPFLR